MLFHGASIDSELKPSNQSLAPEYIEIVLFAAFLTFQRAQSHLVIIKDNVF